MMWLVRLALKRPYTFVVMSMLIVIVGILTISRMPTDIFPDIDIPVISIVFNYSGLAPEEMEKRMVNNYERVLTTTVNDIEHIESQSLTGIAVVKIFFQPGARIEAATAQVTAVSEAIKDIGDLPIKEVNGTTIYIRDVASVRDGYSPQTNMVHVGTTRSVLMS